MDLLDLEQVPANPSNDWHFSLFALEEKVEYLELVFQVTENYLKLDLPFAYDALGMDCSLAYKGILVHIFDFTLILVPDRKRRHERL